MNGRLTTSRLVLLGTLAAGLLLLAVSAGTGHDASQKTQPSETLTMELSLIVTDASGHSVDTVRQENIRLLEDGIPQTLTSFSVDHRPVDYGIAFDRSGSFRRVVQEAIDAAKSIVKNNRPDDETFLETFVHSDKIETLVEFTRDEADVLDGFDSIYVEGGQSAISDAVYLAVEHIAKRPAGTKHRRQALVLITDGEDRSSYYQQPALEKLLTETDVQIFVIGFVSEVKTNPTAQERKQGFRSRDEATALLTRMAELTGGRVFFPEGFVELNRAAVEIDRDLRSQYRIAYQPAQWRKPGLHHITVEITTPGNEKLTAITRPGYFVPSAEPTKDKKPR